MEVLALPSTYVCRKTHEYSWRSLQLAHQASLRERKNLLQTAIRFRDRATTLMDDSQFKHRQLWMCLDYFRKATPKLKCETQTCQLFNEENPGWGLEHALGVAFSEYNAYGMAGESAQFRLAEREMYAIKACCPIVSCLNRTVSAIMFKAGSRACN